MACISGDRRHIDRATSTHRSTVLCRSLPISADLCPSLPISADLGRSRPIFRAMSLGLSSERCTLRSAATPRHGPRLGLRHTHVGRLGLRRLFFTSWERFHCLPSCPAADPTFIPLLFLLGEFSTVCSGLSSAVFHVLGEISTVCLPARYLLLIIILINY
jgi:hypothetical protein